MSNIPTWELDEATIAELEKHIEAIRKICFENDVPGIVQVQTRQSGSTYRNAGFVYTASVPERCASDLYFTLSSSALMHLAHRIPEEEAEPLRNTVMTMQTAIDYVLSHYKKTMGNINKESHERLKENE